MISAYMHNKRGNMNMQLQYESKNKNIKTKDSKMALIQISMYGDQIKDINKKLEQFTRIDVGEYFIEENVYQMLFKRNIQKKIYKNLELKILMNVDENIINEEIKIVRSNIYTPEILLFQGTVKPEHEYTNYQFKNFTISNDIFSVESENDLNTIKKTNITKEHKMRHNNLFSFMDKHMGHLIWLLDYYDREIFSFIRRWKKLSWNSKAIENYRNGKHHRAYIEYRSLDRDEYRELLGFLGAKINYNILTRYIQGKEISRDEKKVYDRVLKHLLLMYSVKPPLFTNYKIEKLKSRFGYTESMIKIRYNKYINTILDLWGR